MWRKWIYTWMFLLLGCTDSSVQQSTFPGDSSKCQVEDLLSIGIQLKEAILRKDTEYILNLLDPKEKITIEKVEGYTTREKMIKDFAERGLSYSTFFDTNRMHKLQKEYGVKNPSGLSSIRDDLVVAERKGVLRTGVERDPCCGIVFFTGGVIQLSKFNEIAEDRVELHCRGGVWKIVGLFSLITLSSQDIPENCRLPNCRILWEPTQQKK